MFSLPGRTELLELSHGPDCSAGRESPRELNQEKQVASYNQKGEERHSEHQEGIRSIARKTRWRTINSWLTPTKPSA